MQRLDVEQRFKYQNQGLSAQLSGKIKVKLLITLTCDN